MSCYGFLPVAEDGRASCFPQNLVLSRFPERWFVADERSHVQVVVLNSRPAALNDAPQRSAMELSMIIDEADQRRNMSGRGRKSSLVAWDTSLEDLLEDDDGEVCEEEEEESVMEGTVLEAGGEYDEEEEEDRTMEEEMKVEPLFYIYVFCVC